MHTIIMKIKQTIKKLYAFSIALPYLPVLITGCVASNPDSTTLEYSIKRSINEVSNKGIVNTTLIKGVLQDQNGEPLSGMKIESAVYNVSNKKLLYNNKPVFSKSDGSFNLAINTFKLTSMPGSDLIYGYAFTITITAGSTRSTCYKPFITPRLLLPKKSGVHNVGVIKIKQTPEPTGADRYTWSLKTTTPKKTFKLTINQCVREIKDFEFNVLMPIITKKATQEGIDNHADLVSEISLPKTLTKIGHAGFWGNASVSGTLIIPKNVEIIANSAFYHLGKSNSETTAPVIVFENGSKLKHIKEYAFRQSKLRNFTLPENLETIGSDSFNGVQFFPSRTFVIPSKISDISNYAFANTTGITSVRIRSLKLRKTSGNHPLGSYLFKNSGDINSIKLPKVVYSSYSQSEINYIFRDVKTGSYRTYEETEIDADGMKNIILLFVQ